MNNLPSIEPPPTKRTKTKPSAKKPTKRTESIGDSKVTLAERLCLRLARGEQLTADEFGLFAELGWSRIEIERQTRRAESIQRLQEQAGSRSGLASKKAELADLKEHADATIEQLDAQIGELMDERERLAMSVRELESDVTNQVRAMAQLRTKCPPHVLRVHSQLCSQVKGSELNIRRLALRGKISSLSGLPLDWDQSNHDQISAIIRSTPVEERPTGILNERGQVHRDRWRKFAAMKRAELPELQAELETVEAEFDEQMREIDKQLDFYITD